MHGISPVQVGSRLGGHGQGKGREQSGGRRRNWGRGREGVWGRREDETGGSGSNKTPLGARVNTADDAGGTGYAEQDQGVSPGHGGVRVSREEPGDEEGMPGYVDNTPPDSPMHSERANLAGSLGNMVDRDTTIIGGLAEHQDLSPQAEKHTGLHQDTKLPHAKLPLRNQQSSTDRFRYDWAALRRGIRNERGDMVYYDASFVEDPWAELRAAGDRGPGV